MKYLVPFALLAVVACKPKDGLHESQNFSGLYTLSVQGGSALTGESAVAELNKYCDPAALPGYLGRIAQRLSFNAGYAEHPNAGYDASIVKQMGPDGVEGYYIGQGQMFDGAGSLAMMPPTNGSIDRLLAGYCKVALNSIRGNKGAGCAYPQAELSTGGSVNGSSAAGSIGSSGCLIAKMSNPQFKHTAEIAFCPDALGGNFQTQGGGAAGEMSIIVRGGGG